MPKRSPATSKPTAEKLAEFIGYVVERDQTRNGEYKELEALYNNEHDVGVAKGLAYETVRLGYAYDYVNRLAGIFTSQRPYIEVTEYSESEAALRHTSDLEEWLNLLLAEVEMQALELVWPGVVKDVLLYGMGASKLAYLPQMWTGQPTRESSEFGKWRPRNGGGEFKNYEEADYIRFVRDWRLSSAVPIGWTKCNPQGVYSMKDDLGIAEVVEIQERESRSILNMYKAAKLQKAISNHHIQKVKWFEYQNRNWIAYGIAGLGEGSETWDKADIELLEVRGHSLGRPSYNIIEGESIIKPSKELIVYQDRLASQHGTAIRYMSWPYIFKKLGPQSLEPELDETGQRPVPEKIEPAVMNILREGEEVKPLVWTANMGDVTTQRAIVAAALESTAVSPTLRGQSGGAETGYQQNLMQHAAKARFAELRKQFEKGYADIGLLVELIVEREAGSPVYIYADVERGSEKPKKYYGQGPDDIKGYHQRKARLSVELPIDKAMLANVAIQLRGPKGDRLFPEQWVAQEIMAIQNWPKMKALRLKEELEEQMEPTLVQVTLDKFMRMVQDFETQDALNPQESQRVEQVIAALGQMGGVPGGAAPPGQGIQSGGGAPAPRPSTNVNRRPRQSVGRPAGQTGRPGGPRRGPEPTPA
jgi:hypothetical protein